MKRILFAILLLSFAGLAVDAQLLVSGNENKVDLTGGTPKFVAGAPSDTISILDFSTFPPKVQNVDGIANSVIGPPSNIAITPDGTLALIASSIQQDPKDPTKYAPATTIHVLDLTVTPAKVIQELESDKQPSGISIAPSGKFALVANRASGTVSLLSIEGRAVAIKQTLSICKPEENVADVAIAPDGKTAIASVVDGGYFALLHIDHETLSLDKRKFSVCGKPYRCIISPDGALALTAGSGQGLPDTDAVTIVDLSMNPPRTTNFIPVGSGPESLEISPDGKLVAVVLIGGSNLPKDAPLHADAGEVVLLARRGNTFEKVQAIPTGAIPEGVAFTPDGKYVVVGCHPSKELWIYSVEGEKLTDTGKRIDVPGMPSSLRASLKR